MNASWLRLVWGWVARRIVVSSEATSVVVLGDMGGCSNALLQIPDVSVSIEEWGPGNPINAPSHTPTDASTTLIILSMDGALEDACNSEPLLLETFEELARVLPPGGTFGAILPDAGVLMDDNGPFGVFDILPSEETVAKWKGDEGRTPYGVGMKYLHRGLSASALLVGDQPSEVWNEKSLAPRPILEQAANNFGLRMVKWHNLQTVLCGAAKDSDQRRSMRAIGVELPNDDLLKSHITGQEWKWIGRYAICTFVKEVGAL